MSTLLEQKCPCCGGAVEFDVGVQKLKCPFCDTEFDIAAMPQEEVNTVEQFNWNTQGTQWGAGETDGMNVYSCKSCGGEIVADAATGATSCPYCGNQVVMKGQFSGAYRPDLIIPFKLDKKAAKEAFKKHLTGRKFVPKGFLDDNKLEEIKGIYVPHWLFSCDAYMYLNYDAEKIKRWSDKNYDYVQTDSWDVYREGEISFDNIPVDASQKIDDTLMESIEPFDLSQAVDFNTAYLAGYVADKFDVSVNDSMGRANTRLTNTAADAFKSSVLNYDEIKTTRADMNIISGVYKYALLPVWLVNTTWNGKTYTYAMNGQTGKFVGNIPTDENKVKRIGGLCGAGAGLLLYGIAWLIELLGWL